MVGHRGAAERGVRRQGAAGRNIGRGRLRGALRAAAAGRGGAGCRTAGRSP